MSQILKTTFKFAAIGLFVVLLMSGCGRRGVEATITAQERFERGMSFYEKNKFRRAIDELLIVVRQFAGSDYADDAQFYLAMSYFQRGEYILSASEFKTLVNTMSGSPYLPESQYKAGLSYYNLSPRYYLDQEFTLIAIDELQTFVDYYPLHEKAPMAEKLISELNDKLAEKEYRNAVLYMRLKYYRAAIRYFDLVMERYHDTQYAELSNLGKIEALVERKVFDEAKDAVERFYRVYPDSDQIEKVKSLERRAEEGLAKKEKERKDDRPEDLEGANSF